MQPITEVNDTSFSDQLMAEAGILPAATNTEKVADKPASDIPEKPETDKPEVKLPEKPIEKLAEKPVDEPGSKPAEVTDKNTDDIDDEKLLAALRRKTGRDYKSLDEFTEVKKPPTPDEIKLAEEQLRGEAIEFGKANKMFTQTDYDTYVSFNAKDKADVVQEEFVARMMKDDTTLSKDDAQDIFNQLYHIDEGEDTLAYKESQKLIAQQYDQIKQRDFGKITSVTDVYKEYQVFNGFAGSLDKLFQEKLPTKFDFTIDGENVSFPVDLKNKKIIEIVNTIKKDYLSLDMMRTSRDQTGKLDEAGLLTEISKDLKGALLDQVITEIAKSYSDITLQKAKLGRKGVLDINEQTSGRMAVTADMGISDQLLAEAGYPSGQK